MKIQLDQQYLNSDDTPAVTFDTKEPITLKTILLQVCLNEGAKPEEKVKRYSLYRSIKKSKVSFVLLEAEEIALLKKWVTETHSTLVVGQTHEMLERPYVPPKTKGAKDPDDYRDIEE